MLRRQSEYNLYYASINRRDNKAIIKTSKVAANTYRKSEASKRPLADADSGAQQHAVDSTPSFVLGPTGGPYEKVAADPGNAASQKAAIDTLLQQ